MSASAICRPRTSCILLLFYWLPIKQWRRCLWRKCFLKFPVIFFLDFHILKLLARIDTVLEWWVFSDTAIVSQFRRATRFPRPSNHTNCFKSFIHHALLKYQQAYITLRGSLFFSLHCISCLVLYCFVVRCIIVLAFLIFSHMATSSINLNLNLNLNLCAYFFVYWTSVQRELSDYSADSQYGSDLLGGPD